MPSKETPGCLHTSGRFIYAILVSLSLPFIPTIIAIELFAGLSACVSFVGGELFAFLSMRKKKTLSGELVNVWNG